MTSGAYRLDWQGPHSHYCLVLLRVVYDARCLILHETRAKCVELSRFPATVVVSTWPTELCPVVGRDVPKYSRVQKRSSYILKMDHSRTLKNNKKYSNDCAYLLEVSYLFILFYNNL